MKASTLPPLLLLLSVFLLLAVSHAQEENLPLGPPSPRTGLLLTDETTIKLIHNSSGDLAHDYVSQLSMWDRSQLTEGFLLAAEWIQQKAKEFGFQDVNIEHFSEGSKIWKVRKGELWMKAPHELKITSYAELPMSLARNSASTDTAAELVDIGAGTKEEDYRTDVKGKIVLTSSDPPSVTMRAVYEKGALGIVSYWSVPPFDYANRHPGEHPDEVGWSGVNPPTATQPGTFAFMISARRGQELQFLLQGGKKVLVRAVVDAELVPGTVDVVTGVIPGSKYPNEEIVVSAHLDHYKPGSNDNASGSASILEMGRTMKYLIDTKQIVPPLRTIRFLWIPEYSGTYAWLGKHMNDPVKRVANLNFDMLGEDLLKTNAVFAISYTPDSNPSFLNAIIESILDFMNKYNDDRYPAQKDFQIISVRGSRNRLQGRMMEFMSGTDYEVFNNVKIPGTEVLGWPDDYYHSSEDTPDKTDPTQLHRVVFSGLAAMTIIAYADDEHAVDIARQSFVYGKKRIHMGEANSSGLITSATAQNLAEDEHLARVRVLHVYERERAAIRSANLFARKEETKRSIDQIALMLTDDEQTSLKNVQDLAASKARDLDVKRARPTLSAIEKRAARLIPRRNKDQHFQSAGYVFGRLARDTTLDVRSLRDTFMKATNALRSQGVPELRVWTVMEAPSHYADGERSVLDISNAVAAEYMPIAVEIMELYFRAFEKAGVMTITEK